jgi:PAS domain S-box-containing protein
MQLSPVSPGTGVEAVDPYRVMCAPVQLLEWLGVAAVLTDLEGAICECTDAAARLYERQREQLVGASIATGAFAGAVSDATLLVRGSLALGSWQGELRFRARGSAAGQIAVRTTLLFDDLARPAGVLAVFSHALEPPAAAGSLMESSARMRVAQLSTGFDWWEWDPRVDHLTASDAFPMLLGAENGVVSRMSDALAAMPDSDRDRVQTAIDRALFDGDDSFSVEYRVRGADGALRWLEARCEAARDPAGSVTRIYGASHDITARVESGEQLRLAEDFWRAAIDSLSAHVAVLDEGGEIIAVNEAWRRSAKSEGGSSDCLGANYLAVCEAAADELAGPAAAELRQVLSGDRDAFVLEYPCHSALHERWFVMRATRYQRAGQPWVVVSHEDVTDRRTEHSRSLLNKSLLDEIDVSVHSTNVDRVVLSWNTGAECLFGWTAEEAIGRRTDELVIPPDRPVAPEIRAEISAGKWEGDLVLGRKDGTTFPAYVRSRLIHDLDEVPSTIVVVSLDVSERVASERELKLARDHLRAVTDHMGEGLYALGGDGRVTYMNRIARTQLGWSFDDINGRVFHEVAHSRRLDGSPLAVEDCPILRSRRDGEVVRVEDDIFLRRDGTELPVAYTAAPFATGDGAQGCVVVFQDITDRKAEAQRMEAELDKLESVKRVRHALAEDRFSLYEQPIVDVASGQVVQRELLIRMQDPDSADGVIRPEAFLPAAEEYGFILDIDRWVIDRSAELAATGLAVELNVSAASIGDPNLIAHITAAILRSGADPAKLVFEITETALIRNRAAGRDFVERLHEIGCGVALDDFGTGYAGFTYLKHLPVDFLKIDIEFVRDLLDNAASRSVVQAIVKLAQDFNIKTVAEGVEDAQTLELLRELEVNFAQGFHISLPAPLITA